MCAHDERGGRERRPSGDRVRRVPVVSPRLNAEHRGKPEPTDVLSFPIDGTDDIPGPAPAANGGAMGSGDDRDGSGDRHRPDAGPRELGDVLICPEHTADLREAIVHGVLHLVGMDHETDDGEMLALQAQLLEGEEVHMTTRSGFVALAGRPNVGKSTLVNAVVGEKIAIVSDRPQTTRRAIRGVCTRGDSQLVLVDLPGVQRPRDALTARMAGRVTHELDEADVALLILNGEQGIGSGDRFIAGVLAGAETTVTIAVNKVDRLEPGGDGGGAPAGERAGARRRDISHLGAYGRRRTGTGRSPARADARGTAHVRGR